MPNHPQSIVSESAQVAENVEVGPYAIIEPGVSIAAGCRIESHANLQQLRLRVR